MMPVQPATSGILAFTCSAFELEPATRTPPPISAPAELHGAVVALTKLFGAEGPATDAVTTELVMSGASFAANDAPDMTSSVVTASVAGPSAPNSFVSATTAPCSSAGALIGGGVRVAGSSSNALHVNASIPDVAGWTGIIATGDQSVTGASTSAHAMCLANAPTDIRVVEASTDGPAQPNGSTRVTAACPDGFVVV